jgi:L-threonylcarbamoyladenylate synthase
MNRENIVVGDSEAAHARAARVIEEGGLIAYRTDTFYGLGADPFNAEALRALKALKGREDGKPILIIVSDEREADRFISDKSQAFQNASRIFWPGALTLVATARENVPVDLTAGTKTIGVRLPFDEAGRALVRACGGALTATSANPAGLPPARTALEVLNYFPADVDLIVDGGVARSDQPSTVVDVSGKELRLIREGVISREQLSQIIEF